jgi:iron complex outermembrane receptor protein
MKQTTIKKFITYFFIIIFLQSSLNAEDSIDTLLDIYAKENDLSKKTKKEAAGTVIIYTKQDLERMQVKSLSELLKGIPFYSYNENKLGYTSLSREDGFPTVGSDARVYINEREVTSPFYGNGLGIVSKFDLTYIDHIEIYTGVTSFEFGIEPSNIVVRLYTKDPNREIGGQLKTAYGTNKSNETSISYSDILDDFSYYAYLNTKETNEDIVNDASRDKKSKHVFLSLQNDTNRIEYNRIEGETDLFIDGIGGAGDGSFNENETEAEYNLLGWYSTYFDKKLSFSLDYISDKATTKQSDSPVLDSVTVPAKILNPFAPDGYLIDAYYDSYSVKQKEKQISAVLKYKESIGDHDLLGGLQYRKKDFKFKEIKTNLVGYVDNNIAPTIFNPIPPTEININESIYPNLFGFTSEKMYSAFIQDTYSLNDNQAIVAGIKKDYVKPNGGFENQDLSLYRLGYIYTDKGFSFKTFLVSTESRFDPNFYTRFNVIGNIEPQRDDSINIELAWNKNPYTYGINLFKTKQTNRLYSNSSGIQNLAKPFYKQGVSLKNTYNFDNLNRIDTNFYIQNTDNKFSNEKDTNYGAYIRLLNSMGKFDFYNELIYRDGYEGLDAGYDFNSSITYKHTKDLSISLKGENIFDKALKNSYTTSVNEVGPISVITQKFWLTLGYRF